MYLQVEFSTGWLVGGVQKFHSVPKRKSFTKTVYCFPLYSLLQAIGQTTVDFFSLDVEGAEPYVLKGIDFSQIDIKLLVVEVKHCGSKVVSDILVPAGYKFVKNTGIDDIYAKE